MKSSSTRRGGARREPTPEQKEAAQARREKIRGLWSQVAKMSDVERVAFAYKVGTVVTPEGRELSLNNTCLLAMQLPTVSVVGGFQQWRKVGRCVKKGEKGLALWIPRGSRSEGTSAPETPSASPYPALMPPKADTPAGETVDERRFLLGTVFDISQTRALDEAEPETAIVIYEPAPEPEPLPLAAPGESDALAAAAAQVQPLALAAPTTEPAQLALF